jgi:aldose 1-epimerase
MALKLDKKKFGRVHDADVWIWHFESHSVGISVISYGATLTSVRSLNKDGKKELISLGFDSLEPYVGAHPYFGRT